MFYIPYFLAWFLGGVSYYILYMYYVGGRNDYYGFVVSIQSWTYKHTIRRRCYVRTFPILSAPSKGLLVQAVDGQLHRHGRHRGEGADPWRGEGAGPIDVPWIVPFSIDRRWLRSIDIHSGWWLSHPSEKYKLVSWHDEIPNVWKVIKAMFQTTNQHWYFNSGNLPMSWIWKKNGQWPIFMGRFSMEIFQCCKSQEKSTWVTYGHLPKSR